MLKFYKLRYFKHKYYLDYIIFIIFFILLYNVVISTYLREKISTRR
jgi:hypothetical protein